MRWLVAPTQMLSYFTIAAMEVQILMDLIWCFPKIQLLLSDSDLPLVGYVPIESSAVFEEFGDTHIFSGTVGNISVDEEGVPLILSLQNNLEMKYTICQVGNISVGGDVLYDNDGAKMYKDEIMQTICKVFLTHF